MNKRRLIVTSLISIILICMLFIGSTYSIFTSEEVDDNVNVYTTGNLDITYTVSEDNIKLTDSLPYSEDDINSITPYRVTVTNTGNVAYKFNLILSDVTATNSISYDYIMVQVGKLDPISLSSTTDNIIKSDIVVESGSSVDIDVRIYLSDNISNSEIGSNFNAKLIIDGIAVYNNTGEINNSEYTANGEIDNSQLVTDGTLISSYITNIYSSADSESVTTAGEEEITQATDVNLMEDSYGNIRYYGELPYNYVSFNGELWRIIGVFEVEDENGNIESRVKIVRDESIGTFSYDNKPSGTGTSTSSFGSNDWSDARLMMLLNPGYEETSDLYAYEGSLYWNSGSGTCYSGANSGTTGCDFTKTGLGNTAKSLIGQAKYYLGGSSTYKDLYADDYYTFERETTVYSGHATEWTGYVGLIYPSDYMYAADLSTCTQVGYSTSGSSYDYRSCTGVNWLYKIANANMWTISSYYSSTSAYYLFYVYTKGYIQYSGFANSAYAVYPTVYLNSEVLVASGSGEESDPYVLSYSE